MSNKTNNNNTVNNNNSVESKTVEKATTWKQARSFIKWGCPSNGLDLNIGEIEVSKVDTDEATAIVNGYKTPNAEMIPGIAFWVAAVRVMTEANISRKTVEMVLDGKVKPQTMIKRAGQVLSLKFAPVAKSKFKPVAVAQPAAPQGMAFFAQQAVSPVGDTPAETILKLISAGLTPAQAMQAVGMK